MRFYLKRKRVPSITVISLIDILAILLIFFIVTTTFRDKLPQIRIDLPESKNTTPVSQEKKKVIILKIKSIDQIFLDDKLVSISDLASAIQIIQKTAPSAIITMQADKEAVFGTIIAVLDSLKEAGIKNIPAMAKPVH